jgi:hypothetical protein
MNRCNVERNSNMKFRFTFPASPALRLALSALALAMAGVVPAADQSSAPPPVTKLTAPTVIDPATGLPATSWKDAGWKDPDKILPNVFYDGLPLSEVAKNLRDEFKDAFDVLIPNGWRDPNNPDSLTSFDPQGVPIKLRLKNVTASEVFNGMNLMFESENSPVRWELKMNGNRPTAVLRVLPALVPPVLPEPPAAKTKRMIYFVGDLLGDEKSSGMTMEQVVKTVSEVYQMSYGGTAKPSHLQFHKEAQLLIVHGTIDQIDAVQQTLSALRQKAQLGRVRNNLPANSQPDVFESKGKSVAPKAP